MKSKFCMMLRPDKIRTCVHIANFICCIDFKGQSWFAEGDSCVEAFFRKYRMPFYKGYTFIAHNSKGFDSYLLMNQLVKDGIILENVSQGSKLLCFIDTDFKQQYIDSLSFLPMKLSAMPKAMGFIDAAKGYFSHFFNTVQNQKYKGPYPAIQYYGADTMMAQERLDFFNL